MLEESNIIMNAIEIIKDRLYFTALTMKPTVTVDCHFFSVDEEFTYVGFNGDFGPLNLGQIYRYCYKLDGLLSSERLKTKKIVHFTSYEARKSTNATYLIACYSILYLGKTPEEAYHLVYPNPNIPYMPYRDTTFNSSSYDLTLLDCLQAINKAHDNGFFDFETFDVAEYEFFDKIGHMNWILPGKLLAFSEPVPSSVTDTSAYELNIPEDSIPFLRICKVTNVIRLTKNRYSCKTFTEAGFEFNDLYFGATPSNPTILLFLDMVEHSKGATAVHCRDGLGRTGTLMCCYLMKHLRFTAIEAIAWNKILRPGSVIGPQMTFLNTLEPWLWKEGDLYRAHKKRSKLWFSRMLKWISDHIINPLIEDNEEEVQGRNNRKRLLSDVPDENQMREIRKRLKNQ